MRPTPGPASVPCCMSGCGFVDCWQPRGVRGLNARVPAMKKIASVFAAAVGIFLSAHAAGGGAVELFSAKDGLYPSEKIPALKAYIKRHQNDVETAELISLLADFAKEAGDEAAASLAAKWTARHAAGEPLVQKKKKPETSVAATTAPPQSGPEPAEDGTQNASVKTQDAAGVPPASSGGEESGKTEVAGTYTPAPAPAEWTMPTDEEMQEAFAKLPPLKPLPVPPLEPVKTPVPDALLNSAGRRAAIMNVKETLRVMIGDMDEEDEKAFDEKWKAALDFPCPETTEWLKKASPILTELVKRKAEAEEASDEYEEALAEANLYRLNRFWIQAYEAMREMLTVAERVKMLKARMEELAAALEALGEMPDPDKIKKQRRAERKAAEQTMREYFGVQSKIGGWYEAEGMMLAGKPAILDAKGKVVEDAGDWEIVKPPKKMLYIRPLYKYESTGLTVVYINDYDDNLSINAVSMVDDAGGGLSRFSSDSRTTYTPFRDDDGNEFLSEKTVSAGPVHGIWVQTMLYRRVEGVEGDDLYGHTKDAVLGTVAKFQRYNPDLATNKYDKIGVDTMCKLKSDELKETVQSYQSVLEKKLGKKKSVADMPFAKDVYYVLTGIEPSKSVRVNPLTNGVTRAFCCMGGEPDGGKWYEDRRDKIEPPPMEEMPQPDGTKKLVRKRGYSAPKLLEHSENVVMNAMFRHDVKRIEEKYFISNRSGRKMQLDSGSAELHARWMPPTTVVRVTDNKFKIPFWAESSVQSTKHCKMTQGVKAGCYAKYGKEGTVEKSCCKDFEKTFASGEQGKAELEGELAWHDFNTDDEIVMTHVDPQVGVELCVSAMGGGSEMSEMGTMGIHYKYKRMILTEEEADRIAKETVANFTEAMRNEWDAQEFASVASQIDEYVANLKTKEDEAEAIGERIALHEENKRWLQENIKRREEQMRKELETIQKHQDIIQKDADEVNRTAKKIADAAQKIEKERDEWWYELITTGKTWNQDTAYNEAVQRRQTLEGHYSASHGKYVRDAIVADEEISEASKRYAQLEFMRLGDISSCQYEDAMIAAAETGEFKPPKTAFDAICHMQLLESCQRDVERDREAKNVRANVRRAVQRLAEQEDAKMRDDAERLAKSGDEDQALSTYEKAVKLYGTLPPANEDSIDEWRAFGRMIAKVNSGRAGQQAAQAELNLIDAEQRLHNAKCVKGGCTALLCIGSMGAATPAAAATMHNLMMAHFMVDGFCEKGVYGAAEGFVRCYSGVADFIISGVEGYKTDGWRGVALHIGGSAAFHVGMPFIAKSGILQKDVKNIYRDAKDAIKKGAKDGYAKLKSLFSPKAMPKGKTAVDPDYLKFKKQGVEALSEYVARVNDLHALNEMTMTNEQIQKAREAVVKAAAVVNQHPDAKIILKNDPAYRKIAERFNEDIGRVYKTTVGIFHKKMAAEGFSHHDIKQFRNASSKGTVGMDADYGMAVEKVKVVKPNGKVVYETVPITQNGKRVNLVTWRDKGAPKLHEAYKEATFGVGDGEKAWINLTTSKYAEAYRCGDILTKTGTDAGMREILDKMSLSDMQQTMDVTRFKAQEILASDKFPRLARVVEVCRGTAKDLNTKVLRAIDVRLKDLQALKIKKGAGWTAAEETELTRISEARKYYGRMADVYTKIGNHTIEPHQIDDAVKDVTADQGVLESLDRLSVFMQTLVLK